MIFGEYLGEVVSNGEYEVRAQGTDITSLSAAIEALTDEEYLDSFIVIRNSSLMSSNDFIMHPNIIDIRQYINIVTQVGANASISTYYDPYSGNIVEITKTISNGSQSNSTKQTNNSSLTLNSWKLYVRKAVLAIPGEGNIAHIIAPVQKTLTAVKAYSKDDQFIYNDDLYKATTSIALGGTITIGTNAVRANSITEQMKENTGGLRYKYFDKRIDQTFTNGQNYQLTTEQLGLGNIYPKGFALEFIGYNTADTDGILMSVNGNVRYICKATNTDHCQFRGVCFY